METIRFADTLYNPNFDLLSKKVYQLGISQSQGPRLREIGYQSLKPFILKSLERMHDLEVATEKPLVERITEEDLEINALWCPSAPGNWLKPWKKDRYERAPFTKWWDRTQMIESVRISQTLGYLRGDSGPKIVYNGRTEDENNPLRQAIHNGGYLSKVLKEKIHFIDTKAGEQFNSLEQVRNFELPSRKLQSGDNIGIVIRPGQAERLAYFLNNPKNGFPEGVRVKMFPVKTGPEGLPRHHIQETCGLLYYRFTSGDAAETPYPYVV